MTGAGPGDGRRGTGDGAGGDREDAVHLDATSEIEPAAEAEVADVELDLTHPLHPLHAGRPDRATPAPATATGTDAEDAAGVDPVARVAGTADNPWSGPMPNHHVGRQRVLVLYLRIALVLAFVVGVVELLIPEQHRDAAGAAMVAVFVAAPLGRVVWLVVRWQRRGDWRFALVGLVLLAVVLTGFIAR